MKVVPRAATAQKMSLAWRQAGKSMGLVPTMGALHAGHLELMRRARADCDVMAVSIYVNPAQFGPREDLARYPRPRREDLALCRAAKVDLVFAPDNLYLPDHSTFVEEEQLSQGRDGASRPGHFRGVATVVLKLFHLLQPTRAYFGQKDAQQLQVIERMVRDLNVPVKIIPVETVRDADGVALSSRNRYLSQDERAVAVKFAERLQQAARNKKQSVPWLRKELKRILGLRIDYVELAGDRLCAAVWVGKTRLIDNEKIRLWSTDSRTGD